MRHQLHQPGPQHRGTQGSLFLSNSASASVIFRKRRCGCCRPRVGRREPGSNWPVSAHTAAANDETPGPLWRSHAVRSPDLKGKRGRLGTLLRPDHTPVSGRLAPVVNIRSGAALPPVLLHDIENPLLPEYLDRLGQPIEDARGHAERVRLVAVHQFAHDQLGLGLGHCL